MLSIKESVVIKNCAFNEPANFQSIRAALSNEGFVVSSNEVRMLCYGLVHKGLIGFGKKSNRFIVTAKGEREAEIPSDKQRFCIDELHRKINKKSALDQQSSRYRRRLLPLKKLAMKEGREIPGSYKLIKEVVDDISNEASMGVLLK